MRVRRERSCADILCDRSVGVFYKSSCRQSKSSPFFSGLIKQNRKYRWSRKGKVEQLRIISLRRMAWSKRSSAVTSSFKLRARTKLAEEG